jgi:hypothetical protein
MDLTVERESRSLHDGDGEEGKGLWRRAWPLYDGVHDFCMKCQSTWISPVSSEASFLKTAGDMSE